MKRLADLLRDPQFRTDVGNNARDFLQSASNTAASNVTAPVDGLAWLLRKFNVPVPQAPVGGSDWAQNAGLMAEPKNKTSLASLLGEAAGNIAPIAGYAKAPQIAGGLLKADEALQGPASRMVDKYMDKIGGKQNMVVYHGSPHKFDAFDASKIGTGEGAQAYGHGLYLAENPQTAQTYQKALSAPDIAQEELPKVRKFWENISKHHSDPAKRAAANMEIQKLDDGGGKFGSLYKVDLPDEHIAKMLDWDAPMTGQSDLYKQVAKDKELPYRGNTPKGGMDIYNSLVDQLGSAEAATKFLRDQGIPGIRYLDGGSRGAGQGSSNFVVFPGNESLLKILSRNGQNLP